jgi:hypothetical protein
MLELLAKLKPGGKYHCPTWIVRCPFCGSSYNLSCWPSQIRRTSRCKSCSLKGNRNQTRKSSESRSGGIDKGEGAQLCQEKSDSQ